MAEFETGWDEPLELGGMDLPEEAPRLGGSPEGSDLKDYPKDFKHFSTMDPEFLELGPIPLGSVLTMTWSESGHPTPGLAAVLVVGADYQENGVWLDVRLLGADAEWAKKKSISIFSKRKLPIHLCVDPARHRCEETAAHHVTEFGYWPPGKFKAAYVERAKMTMMNKYLLELDNPEKAKEKEVTEGSTPERLAALRQKLLKAKSKGTGQSPFVSFQSGAPRVSILKRPLSTPAKIKPEADAVVVSSDSDASQRSRKRSKKPQGIGQALYAAVEQRQLLDKRPGAAVELASSSKRKKKKKKEKKKKKKDSSSGSSYSSNGSSSDDLKPPLQKKAERKPGSVLKMLMDHVRLSLSDLSLGHSEEGGAASSVTSTARVQSYFQILVRPQLTNRLQENISAPSTELPGEVHTVVAKISPGELEVTVHPIGPMVVPAPGRGKGKKGKKGKGKNKKGKTGKKGWESSWWDDYPQKEGGEKDPPKKGDSSK